MTKPLDDILTERQTNYGDYKQVANLVEQANKLFLTHNIHKGKLLYTHEYTIKMILLKLTRLVNGNANHIDSWVDIQGYCELMIREIQDNTKY